ncbi:putative nuclease HARBI1 [Leptopilina boulardi]|uniref:putative nuclease HARBI1 n=1 Tax=Leptopilina boulardi TaxID=63433 RepID=UPI0021F65204|nr:putative nuclease HARBI1 [Leptopilina boulardi]
MQIAHVLNARASVFISWPGELGITINQRDFLEIGGFPGVIRVVDGCLIKISAPHENPDSYIDRKGHHSINMQAIFDSRRRFIDVYAACPGSVNDARVWSLSTINQESLRDYDRYFPEQTHILGDKIYPVRFNLMPPFKGLRNLGPMELEYNRIHILTRQIIERAFALLLQRFRRLKYLYLQDVAIASLIILACCCLHNVCISLNDVLGEEEEMEQLLKENGDDDNDDGGNGDLRGEDGNMQFPAILKRNIIAEQLYTIRRMQ